MADNYIRRTDFVQQFIDSSLNICPFCGSDMPYWTVKDSFEYPARRFHYRCFKCGGTISTEESSFSSRQKYFRIENTGAKNVPLLFVGHELTLDTLRETAMSVITAPTPAPDLSFKPRSSSRDRYTDYDDKPVSIALPLVFAIIATVLRGFSQYAFWEEILSGIEFENLFDPRSSYLTFIIRYIIESAAYDLIIIEIALHGRGKHTLRGFGPALLTAIMLMNYSQFETAELVGEDYEGFYTFLYILIIAAAIAVCCTYIIRTEYFKKGIKTAACITVIICIVMQTLTVICNEDYIKYLDTASEYFEFAGPYINFALNKVCIYIALMAYTPGKVNPY